MIGEAKVSSGPLQAATRKSESVNALAEDQEGGNWPPSSRSWAHRRGLLRHARASGLARYKQTREQVLKSLSRLRR